MQPAVINLDRPWRLSPEVALRHESFGALAYHYGSRRLSFLKSRALAELVDALEAHPNAREACRSAGIDEHELPRYEQALSTLAHTGMIKERAQR